MIGRAGRVKLTRNSRHDEGLMGRWKWRWKGESGREGMSRGKNGGEGGRRVGGGHEGRKAVLVEV